MLSPGYPVTPTAPSTIAATQWVHHRSTCKTVTEIYNATSIGVVALPGGERSPTPVEDVVELFTAS